MSVRSVERAFSILNALVKKGPAMGVNEIARQVQLNPATAHRLLQTLTSINVITQDPNSRKYYLGPQLIRMGSATIERFDFVQTARPYLAALSSEVRELTSIGILDGFQLVYIDYVDRNDKYLSLTPPAGRREFAHCTALGKILLANLPKEALNDYFQESELIGKTENTITDKEKLRIELDRVRDDGFSFDREETELGICCVAAPIWDASEKVVAAISISGPKTRMLKKGFETNLRDKIVKTASKISKQTLK